MVSHGKDKVIQVQKPAQSLQAFQKKVASGEDIQVGYLKPILMAAGVAVLLVAGFYGYRAVTQASLEKNQVALADLQLEVTGDPGIPGSEPASTQDMEQRMRDRLPRLEALARSAPSGARAVTEAYLADWRLQLGIAGAAPASSGVWAQLRLAQKQVAMGQGAVNWPELFAAAKTGGVKNYFVEMDLDLMKASIPYLHSLKA